MFYFKTDQYNAIFQEVEKNVKALACRNRTQSNYMFLFQLTINSHFICKN